jgi:predicted nucleic-acid-binding Zn-ribbon protein
MSRVSPCSNCGSTNQYRSRKPVSSGGGHAPVFLPGLGPWYSAEKFEIVVCGACGLTRFFARNEALEKLAGSEKWERI